MTRRHFVEHGALWVSATALLPRIARAAIVAGPHTSKANPSGGSASVTTNPIDTTGMTASFVAVSAYGQHVPTTVTVTDNKGNTYTAVPDTWGGSSSANVGLFYYKGLNVGAGHTFTASGGGYSGIAAFAVSGAATAGAQDQSQYNVADPTIQPGAITPTTSNQIIVSLASQGSSGNVISIAGSGFILLENLPHDSNTMPLALAYVIQTVAASSNPTWTVAAGGGEAMQASFQSGAAALTTAARRRIIQ